MITAVIVAMLALAVAKLIDPAAPIWADFGARYFRVIMDQGVMLYLVIPAVVLGTSAFILLRSRGDVFGYALCCNFGKYANGAALCLPFV